MNETATDQPPVAQASLDPPETKCGNESIAHAPHLAPTPSRSLPIVPPRPSLAQVFRHSGWLPLRTLVHRTMQSTGQALNRRHAFETCGSHAYLLRSLTDPNHVRVAGSSCHDRFCVPCANERSRAIANNVVDHLGTTRCRFLTLTVRTANLTLAESLDKLARGFNLLRKTRLWKQRVTGGVAFTEITFSPDSQTWHPHIHALITGTYVPHPDLRDTWLRVTGDSTIVSISRVSGRQRVIRYVTKYASKPLHRSFSADEHLLAECMTALRGRRLCTTFGGWRGVLLIDHPNEDGWENLGDLDGWIRQAATGEPTARHLIDLLDPNFLGLLDEAMEPHPPPPSPHPPPITGKQSVIANWMAPAICY